MLAESKFNSIETLISKALNDLDISHEEFKMILNEKEKYERRKYNLVSEIGEKKARNYKVKQYLIKIYMMQFFFFFDIYNSVRDNKK